MTWDPHREDEARWIAAMRQRHARGQEYVCGLADVLRTLEERDEAQAKAAQLRDALRKLLLSRDAAWAGGHDWQEAVDGAITALGIEVDE